MSTTSRSVNSRRSANSKRSANNKRGGGRKTRAGNNIDGFPFEKLSVDGAALAKMIISPLPTPTFAALRTRDPLNDRRDSRDSTSSTQQSSDEELPQKESPKKLKDPSGDQVKAAGASPSTHQFETPPTKQLSKYALDLQNSRNMVMKQLPEGKSPPIQTPELKRRDASVNLDGTGGTGDLTETNEPPSSPSSHHNRTVLTPLKSPEPTGKHITGIFRRTGSDSVESDDDSYYEVYETTPQGCVTVVSNTFVPNSPARKDYSSDEVGSSGWESGMSLSAPLSSDRLSQNPSGEDTTTGSGQSSRFFGMNSRVGADGTVHVSPNQPGRLLSAKTFLQRSVNFNGDPHDHPQDPDGDFVDNGSTHGESMYPTLDETFERSSNTDSNSKTYNRNKYAPSSSSSRQQYSSSEAVNMEESSSEESSSFEEYVSEQDPETPPMSVSTEKQDPKNSPFPSYRFLVSMVILIVLVGAGLIAGLTYYLWEKYAIDPICPPDDPCCNNPSSCTDYPGPFPIGSGTPLVPNDAELLDLFESVVGQSVRSDLTSAGKAANWMLYEDPGKLLKPRSDNAWIQRYLLVYTYYSTTLNRETSWLSCNPPKGDNIYNEPTRKDETGMELNDKDACMFTYPTELPGGNVIYDLVPSYRWLSGADECQWGGVACGKTVTDEISVGTVTAGSKIPIKSTMQRLAVTSIVLSDQALMGSIVTELTSLPMLQVLDLSHNSLQGTLSDKFRSLETLRLQYNTIQGRIPNTFFDDQSVMKELNIGSNFMTGTVPEEIGLTSTITDLYLFNNEFTGRIPVLGNMPLVNFHGHQNAFTGILPFDYGFDGPWPDTLREWWVHDNKVSGSLSENLGFLTSLEDLRVNGNGLTGKIPESIQDLQRLFRLHIQSNALTGTVPDIIGDLPELRDVRLQYNKFGGVVPTSLCFLESMEVLEADCLAFQNPQTECFCCTSCCNPSTNTCEVY